MKKQLPRLAISVSGLLSLILVYPLYMGSSKKGTKVGESKMRSQREFFRTLSGILLLMGF